MPRVRPVALGALLRSPQPARLRRLCQMRPGADRAQLLDHEPPAGRRLQRHLKLAADEAAKEPPHALAVRRRHTRATDLAGRRVNPLGRDLRPVLIEAHHDPARTIGALERARRPRSAHLGPHASHTVGHGRYLLLQWPAARVPSARAFTNAVRRGGPATFNRAAPSLHTTRPGRRPAHAIFHKSAYFDRD